MRNFSFLVLACLGFVFIMLGGFLIIYGVLRNNELAIYISLGIIIGAVILFVAHAFNMVLALLSIIVHGVRLNTLEFGGRVGLEWSGYRYAPFKN